MFKRLYNWTISLSESPRAPYALGAVSFAESSFFPVPPDVMLLPMSLARPDRAFHYALICTITSVVGGIVGYMIGSLLYDSVGQWLIKFYGLGDKLDSFRALYQQYGHWIILIKGMTPIPYKLVTIASGLAGYDFFWFVVLSIITRGARFFLLAGLLNKYGVPIRAFVEKNLTAIGILLIATIVGGFYAVKYLF